MSEAPSPEEPAPTDGSDPLDRLADRLLEDLQASGPAPGGRDWIRATLARHEDADPLVGALFQGKYRVLRRLGRGGFGAVYEALDERGAGNRVALKVQLPGIGHAAERLESFRAEALRVTRLQHPNVVDWKSFDETPDGGSYFVMELVDGRPLSELIAAEAPLEWRRAGELLAQILSALRAAHEVGRDESILHLDLKPRNVLVVPARDGRPETAKVIDFGIGQHLGRQGGDLPPPVPAAAPADGPASDGGLTTTSATAADLGRRAARYPFPIARAYTAEYASPEQCVHVRFADGEDLEPRPLDGRADLYSLGVLAHELLTGRLPYRRPALRAAWLQVHLEAPREPWTAEDEARIPRRLRRLVDRLLERDPGRRPPSAAAALAELQGLLRPPLARRLVPAAVLLVGLGALLARLLAPGAGRLELLDPRGAPPARVWVEDGAPPPALELGGDLPRGAALELVDDGGEALAGWGVELEGSAVRLAPPARAASARVLHPKVRLRALADGALSDAFDLVRLGPGAREVALRLGEEALGDGGPDRPVDPEGPIHHERPVDPEGLVLALDLPGLEVEDLSPAGGRLRLGDEELAMVAGPRAGGGALVAALLPAAPDGPLAIEIEVPLAGAPALRRELRLEVAAAPLDPVALWLDDEGRELAWGAGGVPGDAPARLRLRAARPARVEAARGEGPTVPLEPGLALRPSEVGGAHADLELPAAWLGGTPPPAQLALLLDDGVLRGPASEGRHRVPLRLPLRVLERRPFQPTLVSGADGGPDSGAVTYHDGRAPLRLAGLDLADPDRVRLELVGRDGATLELAPDEVGGRVDLAPRLAGLGLAREGRHRLVARSWALDADGTRIGPAPLGEAVIELEVDRTPPEVAVASDPLLVTPLGPAPELLLHLGPPGGAPLVLRWRLLRADDLEPVGDWRLRRPAPGAATCAISPLEPADGPRLPDGAYLVEVLAQDLAGNAAPPLRVPLEVARTGPRLTPLSPAEELEAGVTSWETGAEGLAPITVEVRDRNGVAGVECRVRRASQPGPGRLLSSPPLVDEDRGRWTWRFQPPAAWSRAEDVVLLFTATDRHGLRAVREHGPFRLPRVRERFPARVGDLWLLPGNDEEPYFLHGRADTALENRALVEAGLRPVWVAPGRELPGVTESPWAIPVPPGALAPYYLAEREVSCGEFLAFVTAPDGYAAPANWSGAPPRAQRRAALAEELAARPADRAVTGLWYDEAEAFAAWRGLRLPTLLELEHAVRGGVAWRTRSWDADGSDSNDPADPHHRVRGLSDGAEWTSSPARTDGAGGIVRPADLADFLPDAAPGGHRWIAGATAGHVLQGRAELRADFGAVDVGEARGWSNPRVGFRLASSARELASRLQEEAEEGSR